MAMQAPNYVPQLRLTSRDPRPEMGGFLPGYSVLTTESQLTFQTAATLSWNHRLISQLRVAEGYALCGPSGLTPPPPPHRVLRQ
jgi:hypothetical protein